MASPRPNAPSLTSFLTLSRGKREALALDFPSKGTLGGAGEPSARLQWSYGELDRRATLLQRALAPEVSPESIWVLLFERDSPELYAAWLACLRAGAAPACVDPSFPDGFLEEVLEDAKAPLLLTDAPGSERARALECGRARIVDVTALATPAEIPGDEEETTPAAKDLPEERLAYVIYTSGTTGKPKGVMIERGSLANLIAADLAEFGISGSDRVAQVSSPAYDSWVEETWLAFAAGATLVVVDKETQRLGPDLVPWLRAERISVFCPPPTLLRMAAAGSRSVELPDLRLLYVGGEALTEDVVECWAPGRRLVNGYGPTECTVTVIRGDVRIGEEITLGEPVPGNEVLIDDGGEWLEGPGTGELCLAGLSLARGYLRRDRLTEERFPVRSGLRFYSTGDRVTRNERGELLFRGRIDSQVKLHGQRIELEAIEARIAESAAVRDVACAVQTAQGRERLTAYLVLDGNPGDWNSLQQELTSKLERELPSYMVPRVFSTIEELPRGVSGKVQRNRLPAAEATSQAGRGARPQSALEDSVARVFAETLGLPAANVSRSDDFFLDLGGDSLTAVRALVALRANHESSGLTTRDLYEARTVRHLAERMSTPLQAPIESAPASSTPRRVGLVTMLQVSVLACEFALGSAALYVTVFEFLPRLVQMMGLTAFLLLAPLGFALTRLALSTVAAFALAGVKRLFFARTSPGHLPVWSLPYFRAWLLAHWSAALPWSIVQGTELHSGLLRLLGAKIGRRVHLHRGVSFRRGGWDLLRIGDDVTLAQDSHLRLADLEDGHLVYGPIELGDRVTLDVRATVGADSVLADGVYLSALSYAESGSRLAADRMYDGLPAQDAGPAPEREELESRSLSSTRYAALHLALHLVGSALAGLPAMLLLLGLARSSGTSATEVLAWLETPHTTVDAALLLAAALFLAAPLGLLFSALLIRVLGEVRPGRYPRSSANYLRIWWKSALVERAGRWLSGSLFWPLWLRAAGCRIGRGSEISTIIDVIPERLSIGSSCFFADGIYLGGPRIHRGVVTVENTVLGDHTFLGNHVVVPNGARLSEESFYGVCTVAQRSSCEEGKEWFGHPPLRLPRREVRKADRALTHEPGPVRYVNRLLWESARFALPLLPTGLAALWMMLLGPQSFEQGLWIAPAVTLGVSALSCASLWATKWLLLGRVRPAEHALWSCWCSRWDFVYVAWQFWARGLLARLEGTLILAPFLRAMGMKIGRRVVLDTGFAQVVDPDMLEFEDDCTVSGLFQAHSFEDRILKVDRVRIGREASVAHGALLFYDVELADRARLRPHAVAMKGERLEPRTYAGSPCA